MLPKAILIKNKKKSLPTRGIKGTHTRPRLAVYRSNRYIYAQLIDDFSGKTLLSVNEKNITNDKAQKVSPVETAKLVGLKIAELASKHKIKSAIFDRGPSKYHGRVKNVAEGAREGGLKI